MSCENWAVGDHCKAAVDMEVDLAILDPSGSFTEQVIIRAGTPGVVRVIERENHVLHVEFEGSTDTARLDHEKIHNLAKR